MAAIVENLQSNSARCGYVVRDVQCNVRGTSNRPATVIDLSKQRVRRNVCSAYVDRSISANRTTWRAGNVALVENLKVRGASAAESVSDIVNFNNATHGQA